MQSIKRRPYDLLLWIVILLIAVSLFVWNKTIDLLFHDTYFILSISHVFWATAIWLIFIWILYVLTRRILYSKILTRIHVVVTIVSIICFLFVLLYGVDYYKGLAGLPRRYYDYSGWDSFIQQSKTLTWSSIILGIMILSQFFYIANLLLGLFKRQRFDGM